MKITPIVLHRHISQLIGVLIADGLTFGLVNPQTAPSTVIVLGLLLLVTTVYMLLRLVIEQVGERYGLQPSHARKLLLLTTVVVASAVGLQSIGQLTFRDIVAFTPFVFVLYFYLTYLRK